MVMTRAWRGGAAAERDFPVERVSDLVAEPDPFVWVDHTDPRPEDLADLEEELGVHVLAVEDALEDGQRPKLDRYRDSLFLVVYDVVGRTDAGDLVTHEVKAFVTKRALITIHGADADLAEFEQRLDQNADMTDHGVAWLVWALLDTVVDHASDVVEELDQAVTALEDDLFEHGGSRERQIQQRSFALRKQLGVVRRLVVPTRDSVTAILHGDAELVVDGIRPYFRDVQDHLVSIGDSVDQLRDAVGSVLDTNLGIASNHQNVVMKKVTGWAAIIAIPTAITGFFGQNVKFPGESAWGGLYASLSLIVVSSLVLYRVFKTKDWL